jgi:hypothetical protein
MPRRIRPGVIAAALCALVVAVPAAAELMSANSVAIEFGARFAASVQGTGCGSAATADKSLPAGATGIRVTSPKVGDRDGTTHVSAVTVTGTVVSVSVVTDDPSVCDPPAAWYADYDVRVEYTRRIQATMRIYYESYLTGAKWRMRPATIRDTRAGAPPGDRISGIRWKRFGGKTAEGVGILHLDYCRRGDNCPFDGKRVRLVARNAGLCRDSGKVEYVDLAVYVGKIQWSGMHLQCG